MIHYLLEQQQERHNPTANNKAGKHVAVGHQATVTRRPGMSRIVPVSSSVSRVLTNIYTFIVFCPTHSLICVHEISIYREPAQRTPPLRSDGYILCNQHQTVEPQNPPYLCAHQTCCFDSLFYKVPSALQQACR